jgi:hypothetical protein
MALMTLISIIDKIVCQCEGDTIDCTNAHAQNPEATS